MPQGASRVELKAGLAVVVGLAVLGASVFLVSGGFELFKDKRTIRVRFQDAGGLTDGTPVLVAGQRRGKVLGLEDVIVPDDDGRPRDVIDVTAEIDEDVRLYEGSFVTVSRTVTGQVQMNIHRGESRDLAPADHVFEGRPLATFEQTIDRAARLLDDAGAVLDTLRRAMEKVDREMGTLDVAALQGDAEELMGSLQRSADTLETMLADAREPVAATIGDHREAAAHTEELTRGLNEGWKELRPEAERLVRDARDMVGAYRALADDNREGLRALVQGINEAVVRMPDVLNAVESLSHELEGTVVEVRADAAAAVRNARGAMENFAALTEDLKSSPWKLVNKPSSGETRFVAIQEAARLYVEAIGRVQRQIDALETLRRLGMLEGEEAGSEAVGRVLEELETALALQEERRRVLDELLMEQAR